MVSACLAVYLQGWRKAPMRQWGGLAGHQPPETQARGGQAPGVLAATQMAASPLGGGGWKEPRYSAGGGGYTEAHLIETQFLVIQATGNGVGARLQVCPALVRAASAHVEAWWRAGVKRGEAEAGRREGPGRPHSALPRPTPAI